MGKHKVVEAKARKLKVGDEIIIMLPHIAVVSKVGLEGPRTVEVQVEYLGSEIPISGYKTTHWFRLQDLVLKSSQSKVKGK
jgi:hypothetical protein